MNNKFVKNKMIREIKFVSRTQWVILKATGLIQNSTVGDDITISVNHVIHNRNNLGCNPTILQAFVFSMFRL